MPGIGGLPQAEGTVACHLFRGHTKSANWPSIARIQHADGHGAALATRARGLGGPRTSQGISRMSFPFIQRLRRSSPVGVLALAGTLLVAASPAQAAACRAAPNGSGDGSSWASAASLHAALADVACTEIWLQQGVYRPSTSDANISFAINRPVQVYGGFAGTETALAQRSTNNRLTVLSGDMAGDDVNRTGEGATPTAADIRGTNSEHVVVIGGANTGLGNGVYTSASGAGTYTRLDGVTITAGASSFIGGGLLCNGGQANCSPAVNNALFVGNRAVQGGAISNFCGDGGICSPTISDSTFSGNLASSIGGAIFNFIFGGESSPTITRSTFRSNFAENGGAISVRNMSGTNRLAINSSTFSGNTAEQNGGAIFEFGSTGTNTPAITHSTFSANSASSAGGAMWFDNGNNPSTPSIQSSIFWGNTAPQGAQIKFVADPALDPIYAGATTSFSIVQGSGGSSSAWEASLGIDGGNNLDTDPLLGPLADNGGPTLTLLPTALSPAIDQGAPAICNGTDQRGITRPQGAACDIGAVERASHLLTVAVTGLGTVNSSPAAITNCTASGGTCSAGFLLDSVTLTATPDANHRLASWSGGGCVGNTNTCVVSMGAAQSVTATFVRMGDTYTTPGGNVGVEISGSSCVLASIHQTTAPLALPPGFSYPYGQMGFHATGCPTGGALNVRLAFPGNVPAGAQLLKYTGSAWVNWASTPAGANALSFSVTDATAPGNAAATGDLNPNPGVIDDPVVLAVPLALPAGVAIPTLSEWGMLLLATLMGLAMFGTAHSRRRC